MAEVPKLREEVIGLHERAQTEATLLAHSKKNLAELWARFEEADRLRKTSQDELDAMRKLEEKRAAEFLANQELLAERERHLASIRDMARQQEVEIDTLQLLAGQLKKEKAALIEQNQALVQAQSAAPTAGTSTAPPGKSGTETELATLTRQIDALEEETKLYRERCQVQEEQLAALVLDRDGYREKLRQLRKEFDAVCPPE